MHYLFYSTVRPRYGVVYYFLIKDQQRISNYSIYNTNNESKLIKRGPICWLSITIKF